MKITYKQVLIFLLIVIIDIILSSAAIFKYGLDDESFFVAFGVVLIFNLLIIAFLMAFRRAEFQNYFWINLFISPIIFFILVGYLGDYRKAVNNKFESFTYKKNKFILVIHKIDSKYDLFKLIDSSYQYVQGDKLILDDTIVLMHEDKRQVKIYKSRIFGFPGSKDTVVLTARPDLYYYNFN